MNFGLYTREIEKRFSILGMPITIETKSFTENVKAEKEVEVVLEDDYGVKTVKIAEEDMPHPKQNQDRQAPYFGKRKEKEYSSKVVEPISSIPSDMLGLSDYENTKGPLAFRIRGEVLKIDSKTTETKKYKSGKLTIFNITITDNTDTISSVKYIFDDKELEVVAINDLTTVEDLYFLLKYDSNFRMFSF